MKLENHPHAPLTILHVDDASDNRFLVLSMLKGTPHRLISLENGAKALEAFIHTPLDIILMDMMMPIMDGFEATRMIREMEVHMERKKIPIIAITANDRSEDLENTLKAGCDFLLPKPICKDKLLEIIARFCGLDSPASVSESPSTIHPPPTPSPTMALSHEERERGPLDLDRIGQLKKEIGKNLQRVLTTFSNSLPERLEKIETAWTEHHTENLKNAAHKIKGTSATIGAMVLSEWALKLEHLAKEGKIPDDRGILDAFRKECDRVHQALGIIITQENHGP